MRANASRIALVRKMSGRNQEIDEDIFSNFVLGDCARLRAGTLAFARFGLFA
jgi:hypothetical protein